MARVYASITFESRSRSRGIGTPTSERRGVPRRTASSASSAATARTNAMPEAKLTLRQNKLKQKQGSPTCRIYTVRQANEKESLSFVRRDVDFRLNAFLSLFTLKFFATCPSMFLFDFGATSTYLNPFRIPLTTIMSIRKVFPSPQMYFAYTVDIFFWRVST